MDWKRQWHVEREREACVSVLIAEQPLRHFDPKRKFSQE